MLEHFSEIAAISIKLITTTATTESLRLGEFVKWQEMLGLCGIVFAISEFMEKNNLRTYIFKFSNLANTVYQLILLSLICVIGATALFLTHRPDSSVIRYVGYPCVWEIASLTAFTICVFILLFVSIFNRIPRITHANFINFLRKIDTVIINNGSEESLSAITIILDKNLEIIFQYASQYDDWWDAQGSKYKSPYEMHKVSPRDIPLVDSAVSFIRESLSDERFCNYISRRNLSFVYRLVDRINKYSLPHASELFFLTSLYRELFTNKDSHFSREMDYRGLGLDKPLFNKIFSSLSLIHTCSPFSLTFFEFDARKHSQFLDKYTTGLKISLEEYFKQGNMFGVSIELRQALKTVAETLRLICADIMEIENDSIYKHESHESIMKIANFYSNLHYLIIGNSRFEPKFDKSESLVLEDSVTEGIAESVFNFLDALTILKNNDYARFVSTMAFWVIFPVGDDNEVRKNITNKILKLIQERIEENKKGFYSSMIRLMLNIYGFKMNVVPSENSVIEKYFYDEFKSHTAKLILDSRNKKHLPTGHEVDFDKRVIKNSNGEVIFQEAA